MRIGLYNTEPKIVNAAMMKVSTYHKQQGHEVEPYLAFDHDNYDLIYAFSIFSWTPKHYVTKDMICGGSGFDINSKLPPEIEQCEYDYSLYPDCDYSLVWFSQGCIRNCPFCIVRQKEGFIHEVPLKKLNPNGRYIKVMDNNFFACPGWRDHIKQLQEWGQPVDFQGVDARILTSEMCEALNTLKHEKRIHIAWDEPKINLEPKLKEIIKIIKPYKLMCYVLIGFNSTRDEDMNRINVLRDLNIDSFAMPYNRFDDYQNDFTRWVNRKWIFKTVSWADYKKRHLVEA